MPKEVISKETGEFIGVHWYNPEANDGTIYIEPLVGISISVGENFFFANGEEYEALFFNFESPEQIERYIKTLRRVKRKVFPS